MKIIAGRIKGKKLTTLSGLATRPTLSRIKENIFNILHNYSDFQNLIIVDIFGGSGNLAIETLSRGSGFAFINDKSKAACAVIKQNIKKCHLETISKVTQYDYQAFLQNLNTKIDLLFIDPPFRNISCQQWIIDYCFNNHLLNDGALIILETNQSLTDLKLNTHFSVLSAKKYSKIYIKIIQFYERTS